MMRIGITGGIGSGKSFVCSIFKDYNFKIYNSDFEAKNILNKNQIFAHEYGDNAKDLLYVSI